MKIYVKFDRDKVRKDQKDATFTYFEGNKTWLEWGDFSLNFWFTAHVGRTPAITAANAVRRIRGMLPYDKDAYTITVDLEGKNEWIEDLPPHRLRNKPLEVENVRH